MDDDFTLSAGVEYGRMLLCEESCDWETVAVDEPEGRCTERHLQCIWYSDRLRPEMFTDSGEKIVVESCGRWNLEAGPDFIDAVLLVGAERRRIEGDVELHIRPQGWTGHGHASDPRYSNVVLHLSYFKGPRPADLPGNVICASLRDSLLSRRHFSFDEIDTAAFPHATVSDTPRPCGALWGGDPDRAIAMLRSAGMYRMMLKGRRMRSWIRESGDCAQALYRSVMGSLGYKRNAQSMRLLADLLPLSSWTGDTVTDCARLLGVARLLPQMPLADGSREDMAQLLWNRWWKNSAAIPAEPLEWCLDAVRPQNNPVRRIAAAAAIFNRRDELLDALSKIDYFGKRPAASLRDLLIGLASFPEMEDFVSFQGKPASHQAALVGASCASSIVINSLVPYLLAMHPRKAKEICSALPSETISAPMRLMASRLFGPDHNPRVLYEGNGLLQQGLLQIHNDFCLSCKADCVDCAFGSGKAFFKE